MDLSNENIIHIKSNNIEYLQFKKLLEYDNHLLHAYGIKGLDYRNHSNNIAIDSYKKILGEINLDIKTLTKPTQTHSNNVIAMYEKQNANTPDIGLEYLENADGIVTNKKNISIATTNADCNLIMFFDPTNNVICNVHSGWRGTFNKISQVAVRKMKSEYSCNPKNIIVCLCPSIRACHFEVDEDVMQICKNNFSYTNKLDEIIRKGEIKEGKQKYNIDTILLTEILLMEEGILKSNIVDSGICSVCCSEKIHSRRADGVDYGLGTAIMSLK